MFQRTQEYHIRTSERLKSLETAIVASLERMDSIMQQHSAAGGSVPGDPGSGVPGGGPAGHARMPVY